MRVKLIMAARHDLAGIAKWIAKDSPDRALKLVSDIQRACRDLGDFPEAYPVVLERSGFRVRRRVHGNYLIFYHILAKHVEVLYVIHAARDWEIVFD